MWSGPKGPDAHVWLVFVRVALLPGMSPENGLLAPEREAPQQARLAAHTVSLAREDALWDALKRVTTRGQSSEKL